MTAALFLSFLLTQAFTLLDLRVQFAKLGFHTRDVLQEGRCNEINTHWTLSKLEIGLNQIKFSVRNEIRLQSR